jgi:hypothetical protein
MTFALLVSQPFLLAALRFRRLCIEQFGHLLGGL